MKKSPERTSLATIMHSMPLTRPIPVTIPAAGTLPSYMPSAAKADSSRNGENGSSRASILWED